MRNRMKSTGTVRGRRSAVTPLCSGNNQGVRSNSVVSAGQTLEVMRREARLTRTIRKLRDYCALSAFIAPNGEAAETKSLFAGQFSAQGFVSAPGCSSQPQKSAGPPRAVSPRYPVRSLFVSGT